MQHENKDFEVSFIEGVHQDSEQIKEELRWNRLEQVEVEEAVQVVFELFGIFACVDGPEVFEKLLEDWSEKGGPE